MTQSSHLPHFRTWLNSLSEEELATILRHRPDVLTPLPPSIAALATRLLLRTSIARALGRVSYMRNQTRIAASTTPARYVTA
ncbi:hypothetical protein, partial [Corynebacterium sp. KPL3739]|uniref:hypothetical protein n=1 Tax=Corynebacterium sp. KPL3739 TaxID=3158321 RepID=UPI0032EBB8A0